MEKRNKTDNKFIVVGTNAAGLSSKKESFLSALSTLSPSSVMIQESKAKRKGLFNLKAICHLIR